MVNAYPSEIYPTCGELPQDRCRSLGPQRCGGRGCRAPAFDSARPAVPSSNWRRMQATPASYSYNGIEVQRPRYVNLPRGAALGWLHSAMARATLRCISQRPDVIHAHYAYPCGLAAERVARAWDVPFVLTLHGDDTNTHPYASQAARRRFIRAARRRSRTARREQRPVPAGQRVCQRRPQMLPIGINMRLFTAAPRPRNCAGNSGLPESEKLVLSAGCLLVAKGIRELIRAVQAFRNEPVRFVFAGEGPLEKEVRQSAGSIWMGLRTSDDVRCCWRRVTFRCSPRITRACRRSSWRPGRRDCLSSRFRGRNPGIAG